MLLLIFKCLNDVIFVYNHVSTWFYRKVNLSGLLQLIILKMLMITRELEILFFLKLFKNPKQLSKK
ncbi:hypothetical protein ASF10_16420 [Flavobacterium sp. Leaf82]|nr:hypothetical protein ASF10_16420 [Flavobacterium sp. Leaf82]